LAIDCGHHCQLVARRRLSPRIFVAPLHEALRIKYLEPGLTASTKGTSRHTVSLRFVYALNLCVATDTIRTAYSLPNSAAFRIQRLCATYSNRNSHCERRYQDVNETIWVYWIEVSQITKQGCFNRGGPLLLMHWILTYTKASDNAFIYLSTHLYTRPRVLFCPPIYKDTHLTRRKRTPPRRC
jgi:hypothetical protein